MKIFVLGGYGKTGTAAIQLLAQSDLITKIAVAGRNLERAEKAASEVGEKGIPVHTDAMDEEDLTKLLVGYDMIVNAAPLDTTLPSLRAAIHSGIHYCDMSWSNVLEEAMTLAPAAEKAGTTAIIATGISPCITNLMGVHAARQLDDVEQLQVGRSEIFNFSSGRELSPRQWQAEPLESLTELHEYKSFLAWTLEIFQKNSDQTICAYQKGQWEDVDPIKNGLEVPLVQGNMSTAYPYFSGNDFWGMLPHDLTRRPPADVWFSPFPPQLERLLREQSLGIKDGTIDSETAVNSFFETVESDPYHWLTLQEDFALIAKVWVRAIGQKGDRAAQHTCWFTAPMWDVNGYILTSVALVAAIFKVLRGEIKARGVMLAEKTFEPQSFFDDVVALLAESLPGGKMIDESFRWL